MPGYRLEDIRVASNGGSLGVLSGIGGNAWGESWGGFGINCIVQPRTCGGSS